MIRKLYKNVGFLFTTAGNSLFLLPLFRLFKNRYPCYAIPNADICIEGFPRSGNSFFVAAFQQWNPGVSIAHHSHLASNAKFSARKGKPTVILIREPAEAIGSAIAWDGQEAKVTPGVGLFAYLSFYRSLRKYRNKILYLDFNEAVGQPVECIKKINQRFGTDFQTHDFTADENKRIRSILKLQDTVEQRSEMNSTLPNERKSELKKAIAPLIRCHAFFAWAQALYDRYKDSESVRDDLCSGKDA